MSAFYEQLLRGRVRTALAPVIAATPKEQIGPLAEQLRRLADEVEAHRGAQAVATRAGTFHPKVCEALTHLIALESRGWAQALANALRSSAEQIGEPT